MRMSVPFRTAQLRPRPNVRVQRRFASSSPGGINTEEAQKKAQEALASAGKRLGQAVEVGKKYMGPVGEKAGNMLGCECRIGFGPPVFALRFACMLFTSNPDNVLCVAYREPLLYNFAVAREFLKQVYVAERLQPPTSLSALQNAYSTLWSRATNPAYWRGLVRSGEWAKVGVYAVEAYGIFKVSMPVYDVETGVLTDARG